MGSFLKRRATVAICILLSGTIFLVYGQMLGHTFINYDDPQYVTENPHVRSGLTLEGIRWALTATHASNWHPLTWISHMLDVDLFGLRPGGHHLVSMLLHIANALLLFTVFRTTTGDIRRSALVAALFALHPLHVESVAWVAERKDLLGAFFGLAALWRYTRYVSHPVPGSYWPVLLYFAMSLMAKPMLVTLPFVFLLMDFWPLGRWDPDCPQGKLRVNGDGPSLSALVVEKIPFFILSAASSTATFWVQNAGHAVVGLEELPVTVRLAHSLIAYVAYIQKMVWPSGLAVLYPHPGMSPLWQVFLSGFFLFAVTAAAFRLRRRHPYFVIGWLWYIGTLVPVIGLVQVGLQGRADRYTYIPLIGLFMIVAWGWSGDARNPLPPNKSVRKRAVLTSAIAVLLVAGFAVASWRQVGRWSDGLRLYGHTLQVTTGNYRIHNNMGLELASRGRTKNAIAHYVEALRIKPEYEGALTNLGKALADQHRTAEATAVFQKALRVNPASDEAHNNFGVILQRQGRIAEAAVHFQKALQINPDYGKAHYNLGNLLAAGGKAAEAIGHFRQALRIDPFLVQARNNLGIELAKQGNVKEAVGHYRKVLQTAPDFAETHNNLGIALARLGRPSEAVRHFDTALRLAPDFVEARENLEKIKEFMGGRQTSNSP